MRHVGNVGKVVGQLERPAVAEVNCVVSVPGTNVTDNPHNGPIENTYNTPTTQNMITLTERLLAVGILKVKQRRGDCMHKSEFTRDIFEVAEFYLLQSWECS